MSNQTKIIAVVLGIVVILGAAYLLFFNTSSDTTAVTSDGAPTSAAEVNFLNLSSQIEPVTFDTSILNDPRFTSLVDIHTAILPEASGRKDPFAPLGSS
jgi:flagellar basal body-associated protein FliL